jgi:hypothetical protein
VKGDRLLQECLLRKSVETFADELEVKPLYRLDGPFNLPCPVETNPPDARASPPPPPPRSSSSSSLPAPPANHKNGAEESSSSSSSSSSSELTLFPVLPPPWGPSQGYRPVLDILQVMHDATSPTSKLECLVQAMRAICECVALFYGEGLPSEKAALGADDILGILALVVACARPASLWADVMVMDAFMLSHLRNGEEGYCLTLFMSAVTVLVSKCPAIHDHASLNALQLPPSSSSSSRKILPVLVAGNDSNDSPSSSSSSSGKSTPQDHDGRNEQDDQVVDAPGREHDGTNEEDLEVYVKCNNCGQHMRIADTATHSCHDVSLWL